MAWNFDITPTLALAQKNALTPFADFIQGQQTGMQSAMTRNQLDTYSRQQQARQFAPAAMQGDQAAISQMAALDPQGARDAATYAGADPKTLFDRIGGMVYAADTPEKMAQVQSWAKANGVPNSEKLTWDNRNELIGEHQTISQQIESKQRQQGIDLQTATLENTIGNQNRNFGLEKYKAALSAWQAANPNGEMFATSPMPQVKDFMSGGEQTAGTGGDLKSAQDSIASIESGGNYQAIGPAVTKKDGSTDRALGKYQVMASNLPQWSQEALGRQVSPAEFLASPQIQDAIFNHQFGGLLKQYGPADAASVWFTGRPLNQGGAGASDVNGTTGNLYAQKFMANFRPGSGATQSAPAQASFSLQNLPAVQIDPQSGLPNSADQEKFISALPASLAPMVKQAANYKLDMNKVPAKSRMMFDSLVSQYDPSYDPSMYPQRMAMNKAVQTGQYAQTINSADKVIQHMSLLSDYADALNNGDVQTINAIKNRIAAELGDPSATNFSTLAQGVGTELAKAMKGTGTVDVGSMEEAQKAFGTGLSPAQVKGAIQTGMHMLASAIDPIAFQYKNVMGKDLKWASPRTQAALQKLGLNAGEFGGAPTTAGGFTPVGQPVKIGNSTIQEIN